jgi:hypothetical protein
MKVTGPFRVGRSLALAAFFLGLYQLACWTVWRELPPRQLSTLHGNVSKAQRYLYEEKHTSRVIVGSSMLGRLDWPLLQNQGFTDLGFAGAGPLTGLELMQRVQHYPNLILVETNFFPMRMNSEVANRLFTPGLFTLKQWLSVLREERQPTRFVDSEDISLDLPPPAIFKKLVSQQQKLARFLPKLEQLEQAQRELQQRVASAQQNGSRVIFFEMPVEPLLSTSPVAEVNRALMQSTFPSTTYDWVQPVDLMLYRTTDGIHLTKESGKRYTQYVLEELKRLGVETP